MCSNMSARKSPFLKRQCSIILKLSSGLCDGCVSSYQAWTHGGCGVLTRLKALSLFSMFWNSSLSVLHHWHRWGCHGRSMTRSDWFWTQKQSSTMIIMPWMEYMSLLFLCLGSCEYKQQLVLDQVLFLALMVPWGTFNIRGTFTLHKGSL